MSSTVAIERTPDQTYLEPIIAWRTWRILQFETLSGETSYRLCAVGTHGIPKVWEPRKATVAVCSGYQSNHDAPWPDHDCGLYGFRSRQETESRLETWVESQRGEKAGWALGRVSMWGRIVECERGWRAQYAYPYHLIVYGEESVARAIRNLYAVDVETRAAFPVRADEDETEPERSKAELRAELRSISENVAEIRRELTAEEESRRWWEEKKREDPLWHIHSVNDVDIYKALIQAIRVRDKRLRGERKPPEGIATAKEVAAVMSPNHAAENASPIGSRLWALENRGTVARLRLRDQAGQFWVPKHNLKKVRERLGDRITEPPKRDPLAGPPSDPTPMEVLCALGIATKTDPYCHLYAVALHVTASHWTKIAQRLIHLRKHGFVYKEGETRRWGLSPEGRAALAS